MACRLVRAAARTRSTGTNLLGDSGEGGFVGNAARVVAELNVDVALLSPVGVPGVAHDPVGVIGVLAVAVVANDLDAVVEVISGVAAAVLAGHDTLVVQLPVFGVDADGCGTGGGDVGDHFVLVLVVAGAAGAARGGEGVAVDLAESGLGEALADTSAAGLG